MQLTHRFRCLADVVAAADADAEARRRERLPRVVQCPWCDEWLILPPEHAQLCLDVRGGECA